MSDDGDVPNRRSDGVAGAGEPEAPYELPEIVPATDDPPFDPHAATIAPAPALTPTLPARASAPQPGAGRRPASTGAAGAVASAPAVPAPSPPATAPSPVTGWADHVTAVSASPGLRRPGRTPRVRRVTRVLRHVDPWSMFKVALVFSLVGYLVVLTSGVLLWQVADSTGTLDNVERWFTQFGWETFELHGDEIFRNAWIIGLFAAVACTGGLVLAATVFNLVSDIVGGIRVTVLEEEVVERTVSSTRRYVVRQGPAAGAPVAAPTWDVDDEPAPAVTPTARASGDATVHTADWSVDDD